MHIIIVNYHRCVAYAAPTLHLLGAEHVLEHDGVHADALVALLRPAQRHTLLQRLDARSLLLLGQSPLALLLGRRGAGVALFPLKLGGLDDEGDAARKKG